MRIIVAGSRTFTDLDFLNMILDDCTYDVPREVLTIVQGFAKGPDRMAYDWAQTQGIRCETHLPDWDKYGKAAGPIRNKSMVYAGADLCLIFYGPDGETKGTKSTEDLARKAGIPVRVYYEQD